MRENAGREEIMRFLGGLLKFLEIPYTLTDSGIDLDVIEGFDVN